MGACYAWLVWASLVVARADEAPDAVMTALSTEVERTMAAYASGEEGPYFLGYRVEETHRIGLSAGSGAVFDDQVDFTRDLIVEPRFGSRTFDSSHPLREDDSGESFVRASLPIDDEELALRAAVWEATSLAVRQAAKAWQLLQANASVRVDERGTGFDLSPEVPQKAVLPLAVVSLDRPAWIEVLKGLSASLDAVPEVRSSRANLWVTGVNAWVVDSEGTRVRHGRVRASVSLQASIPHPEGDHVSLYRWVAVEDPDSLPSPAELEAMVQGLVRDVQALARAPEGEPYTGPVLLRGAAAGVWVHEVMGHRLEGHRQKSVEEGQTFRQLLGRRILPASISIYDDPTLDTYAGSSLAGHYAFDEQGQPAQRAELVKDGVLKGFLLSRSTLEGFEHSNGHGRADEWSAPTARMANTILETSRPKSETALRAMLIAEARRQRQPYGLVIEDLGGGYTLTGRYLPNSFLLDAVLVRRVYVDGRPDEVVRGVDLIGTPLVALSRVVAAGDDPRVFNGYCGAESGMVPNSAVSPSLLLSQQEVQRKEKSQSRPPLLPKPEVTP